MSSAVRRGRHMPRPCRAWRADLRALRTINQRIHRTLFDNFVEPANNLSCAVCVSSVTNRYDLDTNPVVIDVVNDPKLTPPRRIGSGQFIPKRLADTVRILGQRSRDELKAGRGNRLRKSFRQSPTCPRRQDHFIGHLGNRPLARISFVTSSRVWKSPRATSVCPWRSSFIRSGSLKISSVSMIES